MPAREALIGMSSDACSERGERSWKVTKDVVRSRLLEAGTLQAPRPHAEFLEKRGLLGTTPFHRTTFPSKPFQLLLTVANVTAESCVSGDKAIA